MPNSPQADLPIAVCAAIIIDKGLVLITRRPADKPHGGYWEFPGGKIDPGESPHESLRRELKEELAIKISVKALVATVHHHYQWGSVLIIAYSCNWLAGQIKHLEVSDHAWVHPDQLEEYQLLPADRPFVIELKTQSIT